MVGFVLSTGLAGSRGSEYLPGKHCVQSVPVADKALFWSPTLHRLLRQNALPDMAYSANGHSRQIWSMLLCAYVLSYVACEWSKWSEWGGDGRGEHVMSASERSE